LPEGLDAAERHRGRLVGAGGRGGPLQVLLQPLGPAPPLLPPTRGASGAPPPPVEAARCRCSCSPSARRTTSSNCAWATEAVARNVRRSSPSQRAASGTSFWPRISSDE